MVFYYVLIVNYRSVFIMFYIVVKVVLILVLLTSFLFALFIMFGKALTENSCRNPWLLLQIVQRHFALYQQRFYDYLNL